LVVITAVAIASACTITKAHFVSDLATTVSFTTSRHGRQWEERLAAGLLNGTTTRFVEQCGVCGTLTDETIDTEAAIVFTRVCLWALEANDTIAVLIHYCIWKDAIRAEVRRWWSQLWTDFWAFVADDAEVFDNGAWNRPIGTEVDPGLWRRRQRAVHRDTASLIEGFTRRITWRHVEILDAAGREGDINR